MSQVFRDIDPEVARVLLDPLLARKNIETAVYAPDARTLSVTGTGSLSATLHSVLMYRLEMLRALHEALPVAFAKARGAAAAAGPAAAAADPTEAGGSAAGASGLAAAAAAPG